jgi:hypothetical protein
MRGDVFGEGKRSRNNVLVEEVDVITLGIGWVVIER